MKNPPQASKRSCYTARAADKPKQTNNKQTTVETNKQQQTNKQQNKQLYNQKVETTCTRRCDQASTKP